MARGTGERDLSARCGWKVKAGAMAMSDCPARRAHKITPEPPSWAVDWQAARGLRAALAEAAGA